MKEEEANRIAEEARLAKMDAQRLGCSSSCRRGPGATARGPCGPGASVKCYEIELSGSGRRAGGRHAWSTMAPCHFWRFQMVSVFL